MPMLIAMNSYWAAHPPVHRMVAAYMGISGTSAANASEAIESASEYVPVAVIPTTEFDAILASHGLPTPPAL